MYLLTKSFQHFPGIGPRRTEQLSAAGIRDWNDLAGRCSAALPFPQSVSQRLVEAAYESINALDEGDLNYFIERLDCANRWRLLHDFWKDCTYLDIETSGLDYDAVITVISCWNGKSLRLFVNGENLDDFPDYILNVPLLVTFNGSTFDLPVIRRHFNLPELPVPHVDMRWICRRCDLTGGLKPIEHKLHLKRPDDLVGTDGYEAVMLWEQWSNLHDEAAKRKLIRYCAADTIALQHVTAAVLSEQSGEQAAFAIDASRQWKLLNDAFPPIPTTIKPLSSVPSVVSPIPDADASADKSPRLSILQQRLKAFLDTKRRH